MTEDVHKNNAESAFLGHALSVSLTVTDLERSLAWYRDVIGFSVRRTFEREGKLMAVSLMAGEARILLSRDDGAQGLDRTRGAGFSIQITTEQNIDALADRIKDRGTTLDDEPRDFRWGQRAFRLRDPDGFKLTISSVVDA
jgi:uncharacterized glyoxalase superfamily protein PhnB